MASGSGWNLCVWLAGGGCGLNLWVWLVGVVIRRYIYRDFLILLIPGAHKGRSVQLSTIG